MQPIKPVYEIQMQRQGDRMGFVVTTSVGRDTWTSPWIEGDGEEARRQTIALDRDDGA